METDTSSNSQALMCKVMIRGIPKEGWKHKNANSVLVRQDEVMIRGIPKEGWKPCSWSWGGGGSWTVMIRGIPKEGWKR